MTRHCPQCQGEGITTTLMTSPEGLNDAWCHSCGWEGKERDLVIEKTFADEFMDRLRAPPVR